MTDYVDIKGMKIQSLDSDPRFEFTDLGQTWYRTDLGQFRSIVQPTLGGGAWGTGGNLNRSPGETTQMTGAGPSGGLLAWGGGVTTNTEIYDGVSWTEVNDLNTGRNHTGRGGAAVGAICSGGQGPGSPNITNTELWNGTNWTEVNDLNVSRQGLSGDGSSTSALAVGGSPYGPGNTNESWNGTNWTVAADMNQGRYFLTTFGPSNTSQIAVAGESSPFAASVESWNGSAWTEVNDLNTGARGGLASTRSSSTNAMVFGASKPSAVLDNVEQWNGVNWSTYTPLNTARGYLGGGGASAPSAVAIGGGAHSGVPESITSTEEWTLSRTTATLTLE